MFDALAIMLAIIIPTILATLGFAWWFRSSNHRAHYLPRWAYSGRIELVVWSIPALIIMFLGGIAWIGSHRLDPAQPITNSKAQLQVDVVSLDWKWLFIYPEVGIASVNALYLPVGVPVHFRITSASVFNVFFVPRLGSEIYAMPGMATQLNLQADKPGLYHGLSAHFSGDGFSDMHFDATALSQSEFDNWAAAAKRNGPVLDETAYRALLKQSQNVRPYTYRGVEAQLFDRIVRQMLPGGEGPQVGRGGPRVSPRS